MIEIIETEHESFKFYVKNENNNVLFTSISFDSLDAVNKAVKKLEVVGQNRMKFERETNHKGEFLFRIKSYEKQLLGYSEPYNSEAGMENGIKNVKTRLVSLKQD